MIDTNVLILWFDPSDQHDQDLLARATILHQQLTDSGEAVFVPVPALMEYLVGYDVSEQPNAAATVARVLPLVDFDPSASIEAARILKLHAAAGEPAKRKEGETTKEYRGRLAIDAQILAIATRQGCRGVYSTDPDLRKLQGLTRADVFDLPTFAESLLEDAIAHKPLPKPQKG